jgi:plasmid stabilization system protein ParE
VNLKKERKVIWSEKSKLSLKAHYDHIKKDSLVAAKRVKSEIIEATKQLNPNPEKYKLDEFHPPLLGEVWRRC